MQNALQRISVLNPDDSLSNEATGRKKEYRVITRVKNNLLLSAIEKAGYKTVSEFGKKANICITALCDIASFRQSPLDKNGDWRPIVHRMCEALNKMPCELFTERQMYLTGARAKTVEVSEAEAVWALENIVTADPQKMLETQELHNALRAALDMLTPREKEILTLYYGLDGPALGLHEISEKFGVTRARIAAIRDRGLRKLRHPYRSREIKEMLGKS